MHVSPASFGKGEDGVCREDAKVLHMASRGRFLHPYDSQRLLVKALSTVGFLDGSG